MLQQLRLYSSHFHPLFLTHTQRFYLSEAQRLSTELSVPDYLSHVHTRLMSEHERVLLCLDEQVTLRATILILEQQLIRDHVNHILSKGFESLMKDKRHTDLALLYRLFDRVSCLPPLCVSFSEYLQRVGRDIVSVTSDDKEPLIIRDLLQLKDAADEVVAHSFNHHSEFAAAIRSAFESIMNVREQRSSELIAKHVDRLLRGGAGGAAAGPSSSSSSSLSSSSSSHHTDDELDRLFDKIMFLFRYVHGKDVFQAFYKKDLAKRLLLGKSASIDAEKSMIAKMKNECGASFTTKLEGMFKDVELSRDLQSEFASHIRSSSSSSSPAPVEFAVHVLTTGS